MVLMKVNPSCRNVTVPWTALKEVLQRIEKVRKDKAAYLDLRRSNGQNLNLEKGGILKRSRTTAEMFIDGRANDAHNNGAPNSFFHALLFHATLLVQCPAGLI